MESGFTVDRRGRSANVGTAVDSDSEFSSEEEYDEEKEIRKTDVTEKRTRRNTQESSSDEEEVEDGDSSDGDMTVSADSNKGNGLPVGGTSAVTSQKGKLNVQLLDDNHNKQHDGPVKRLLKSSPTKSNKRSKHVR